MPSMTTLQWGHRLSAMESLILRTGLALLVIASMGPPPFGDGKPGVGILSRIPLGASMGPPPFGDGKRRRAFRSTGRGPGFNGATAFRRWKELQPHAVRVFLLRASMGPPPFGDGKRSEYFRYALGRSSFNGATAFRRWKVSGGAGVRTRAAGFNGATAFRRWKGPAEGGDSRGIWCFNGATAFRRWKGFPLSPAATTRCTRFNGATAFRRWKVQLGCTMRARTDWLQWGHRLSAMERAPNTRDRIFVPGLQWGHRLSAMESGRLTTRYSSRTSLLQWGHRLSAMESRR